MLVHYMQVGNKGRKTDIKCWSKVLNNLLAPVCPGIDFACLQNCSVDMSTILPEDIPSVVVVLMVVVETQSNT